jgi:ppGpp synthetase/RelA/SpoT-type nucleotidyltranferase
MATYNFDYHAFFDLARLASQACENALKRSGIHAITTFRAKQVERLREKLVQRDKRRENPYSSDNDIYNDIPDLAGVRIALYFPDDLLKVKKIIEEIFDVEKVKKHNRDINNRNRGKQAVGGFNSRFDGYVADHYWVKLSGPLFEREKIRLRQHRVEIQVASLLMHAWSEVNHDLGYKPVHGAPSVDEHRILDSINGIVLTGELLLQQLGAAVNSRIQSQNRSFMSQYDLGAFIQDLISADDSAPLMGRMDILFEVITAINIDSPHKLRQDLANWNNQSGSSVAVSIMDHVFSNRNYMDEGNYEKGKVLLDAKAAYDGLHEKRPEERVDMADHRRFFDAIQNKKATENIAISPSVDELWLFFKNNQDIHVRVAFGIAALGETRILDKLKAGPSSIPATDQRNEIRAEMLLPGKTASIGSST